VTSPFVDRHWSVVQMRRSPSPHELVHRYHVEESQRTILPTNAETSLHVHALYTRIDLCQHFAFSYWAKF